MPDCYDVVYQGWLHARLLQCGLPLCWLHAILLVLQCGLPLCWLHTRLLQCGLPMLAAYQTAVVWLTNADCMPDCYTYTKLQCCLPMLTAYHLPDCYDVVDHCWLWLHARLLQCGLPLCWLHTSTSLLRCGLPMLTACQTVTLTVWFTNVDCGLPMFTACQTTKC